MFYKVSQHFINEIIVKSDSKEEAIIFALEIFSKTDELNSPSNGNNVYQFSGVSKRTEIYSEPYSPGDES